MALQPFDSNGDLPEGVHRATLDEVLARFGHGTPQRKLVTGRLLRIYELRDLSRNSVSMSSLRLSPRWLGATLPKLRKCTPKSWLI
jgi:hypothetical protein